MSVDLKDLIQPKYIEKVVMIPKQKAAMVHMDLSLDVEVLSVVKELVELVEAAFEPLEPLFFFSKKVQLVYYELV